VNPGPGQPAGRRLLGGKSPFRERAGDLVAEMRFDMKDAAEFAILGQPRQRA
jgi:hypothetical protein